MQSKILAFKPAPAPVRQPVTQRIIIAYNGRMVIVETKKKATQ